MANKLINKKLSTNDLGPNEQMNKEILCGILSNLSEATCTWKTQNSPNKYTAETGFQTYFSLPAINNWRGC